MTVDHQRTASRQVNRARQIAGGEQFDDVVGDELLGLTTECVEPLDVHDPVSDLRVEPRQLALESHQGLLVAVDDPGTVGRVAQLGQEADRAVDPEHDRRLGKQRSVLVPDVGCARRRHHQWVVPAQQLGEQLGLQPMELGFTPLAEQLGDGAADGQLELLVGIGEGTFEDPGQLTTNARLARSGHADQHDVAVSAHGSLTSPDLHTEH